MTCSQVYHQEKSHHHLPISPLKILKFSLLFSLQPISPLVPSCLSLCSLTTPLLLHFSKRLPSFYFIFFPLSRSPSFFIPIPQHPRESTFSHATTTSHDVSPFLSSSLASKVSLLLEPFKKMNK